MTLAGFAADDSIWSDFDNGWELVLKNDERRPSARYCHMKEAVHLEREFNFRSGWDQKKVGFLVTDLLMYLQTIDKQRFRQFACTVDLVAWRKLKAEGYLLEDPIRICNDHCPYSVLAWYVTGYPGLIHSAHYFFDQGEPFEEPFEKKWAREKKNVFTASGIDMFWSVIKTVTSSDMRQKAALQAADLLAWATNRNMSAGEQETPFKYLEPIMKQIIPSSWIVWDERTLRERYENL